MKISFKIDLIKLLIASVLLFSSREIHREELSSLQCEAQYPLNYPFPSVATIRLKERNTICAISINKQGSSQQMNVFSNWIKTYLQEVLYIYIIVLL